MYLVTSFIYVYDEKYWKAVIPINLLYDTKEMYRYIWLSRLILIFRIMTPVIIKYPTRILHTSKMIPLHHYALAKLREIITEVDNASS